MLMRPGIYINGTYNRMTIKKTVAKKFEEIWEKHYNAHVFQLV